MLLQIPELRTAVDFDRVPDVRQFSHEELVPDLLQAAEQRHVVEVKLEHFQVVELLDAVQTHQVVIVKVQFGDEAQRGWKAVDYSDPESAAGKGGELHFFRRLVFAAVLAQH